MGAPRVVVVGGSVAGLGAALFLAGRGHAVTVLEKDPTPTPPDAATAGAWRRTATPQAAHSHAFLAGSRSLLGREAPEVLDVLRAAGVRETVLGPPATVVGGAPTDPELVVLNARRSTFEWALRTVAAAHPAVDLCVGRGATGLRITEGARPRVEAVETDDGPVAADVVVDAAGRRSPLRGWVAPVAATDREVACGISYVTRFYRLRGDDPTPLNRGYTHGASFDRYSCLVFPGDDGSFSITFGVLPEDRDLRVLRDGDAFDAAVAAIPSLAPWVDPDVAVATTDVATMANLKNLLRRRDAGPAGLHAIGDAHCVTNPAHTRGCALALLAAAALADAVHAHPDDHEARAAVLDAHTDGVLARWVEDSIGQDADRLARWRPDEPAEQPRWRHALTNGQANLAAQRDGGAWLAFSRLQGTLALPGEVLDDPAVVAAHAAVAESGWRPAPAQAPAHDELVALARRHRAAA